MKTLPDGLLITTTPQNQSYRDLLIDYGNVREGRVFDLRITGNWDNCSPLVVE
jgi:hypothetical protein